MAGHVLLSILALIALIAVFVLYRRTLRCEICGNGRPMIVQHVNDLGQIVTKIDCPLCGEWRRIYSTWYGKTLFVRSSYDRRGERTG